MITKNITGMVDIEYGRSGYFDRISKDINKLRKIDINVPYITILVFNTNGDSYFINQSGNVLKVIEREMGGAQNVQIDYVVKGAQNEVRNSLVSIYIQTMINLQADGVRQDDLFITFKYSDNPCSINALFNSIKEI